MESETYIWNKNIKEKKTILMMSGLGPLGNFLNFKNAFSQFYTFLLKMWVLFHSIPHCISCIFNVNHIRSILLQILKKATFEQWRYNESEVYGYHLSLYPHGARL